MIFEPRGVSPYCVRCRDSPATIPTPRAHHLEHNGRTFVQIGSLADPGSRRALYEALCASCRRGFTAHDPRTTLCLNCRNGADRVRRKRDSKAQRKVHRYVAAAPTPPDFSASLTVRSDRLVTVNYRYVEPAPTPRDFTISLNRGCNNLVIVNVVAGVLETHDAEVAKLLDARSDLRRA